MTKCFQSSGHVTLPLKGRHIESLRQLRWNRDNRITLDRDHPLINPNADISAEENSNCTTEDDQNQGNHLGKKSMLPVLETFRIECSSKFEVM